MFLVDTNVLIEAKNRYYAFDIAPGFWAWLERAHEQSLACSIRPVRDELLEGDDELADWASTHAAFFRELDEGTTKRFQGLSLWAYSQSYGEAALREFNANNADYQLIAYACEHECVVVTHEQSRPDSRRRVMIPDACRAMGVEWVDTFAMLRKTGAQLDLRLVH